MALSQDTRIHEDFCAPYLIYQNDANDANAKVRPKLSLNATLSSTADLKSIPFTYRCILVVGKMLYPCEAMYCANMSIACHFPWSTLRQTCTPKTSNPNSMAKVLEKALTATPPSTPVDASALAFFQSTILHHQV